MAGSAGESLSAKREIERLNREVARLQEELAALRQQADGWGLRPDAASAQQNGTQLRSAERELRESEQRFRELFNLIPASISFTRKSDHVFLEVNRGFEEGSGLRREDVIGRSSRDLDIWADVAGRDALLRRLDTLGDIRGHELWVKTRDGRNLQMSFSASSVIVGGEPGWLSVLTDVTKLRQAEEAVRENERRLQLLVENSTDILGVLSATGVMLSLRGPLRRILGYAPEELVGARAVLASGAPSPVGICGIHNDALSAN